jgi:hypothetical protein
VSDDPIVWIVAALEVVAAAVIAAFWVTWFRQDHDEEWLPAGYVDHEAPFVFSDSLLALVLMTGAILQVAEEPLGDSLGLVAAGMLAFLGVLDWGYFHRTGLFRRERDGLLNGALVGSVLLLAAVLLVRFV